METFRLRRPGEVDLEFTGELLAHAASNARPRWTEIRIFRTEAGQYVTEQVGHSNLRDERSLISVQVVDTAEQVRESLRRADQQYLTNLAVQALVVAGESDPAIAKVAVTRLS